jgi:RimJ/RimL family protein N-acetyltransferase
VQIVLETERLLLRRFTEEDVDNLVELDSDPEVMRFINGGRPTPREEVENEILPRLLAYCRVMEKAGLRYVRTFHLEWPDEIEATAEGDVEYSLTRSEWDDGGR